MPGVKYRATKTAILNVPQPTRQDIHRIPGIRRTDDHFRVMSDADMDVWRLVRVQRYTAESQLPEGQARMVLAHAARLSEDMQRRLQAQREDTPYVICSNGDIHFYKSGCFKISALTEELRRDGVSTLRDRWVEASQHIRMSTGLNTAVCRIHCFARQGELRETTEMFYPEFAPNPSPPHAKSSVRI